jgi:hypothetical protein
MPPSQQPMTPSVDSHTDAVFAVIVTVFLALAGLGLAWYLGFISIVGIPELRNADVAVEGTALEVPVISTASTTPALREGIYTLEGKNDVGSYTGTVSITKRLGSQDVYDLVWTIGSGGQSQRGVGIFTNGVLSVGYYEAVDGYVAEAGAIAYSVIDASHLEGTWVSAQLGGTVGSEKLTLR